MNHLSFRQRLYIAYSIPIVILVIVIALGTFQRIRLTSAVSELVGEQFPLVVTVEDIRFDSARLISSVNEYLFDVALEREENEEAEAGEPELEEVEELRADLAEDTNEIQNTVARLGDTEAAAFVADIQIKVDQLLSLTDAILATEVNDENLDLLLELRGELEDAEEQLIAILDELIVYETSTLAQQQASINQNLQTASIALPIVIPFFFALTIAAIFYVTRSVVQPLGRLIEVAKQLGTGDMNVRANLDPNDEMGQLGLAIDAMATALQARETAYAELTESLEKRVTERTAELAAVTREAKEANRLKSEFLATMSHELRTPLNAIEGFSSIMLGGMGIQLDDRAQNMVSRISANSKRLLHLVNDILDLSRVEAGRQEIMLEPLSPQFLADKWEREVSILAQEKRLEFNVTVDPTLPEIIHQDEFALSKIVINLLSNAFKFTHEGEVSLELLRQDDELQVVVADSGIGIPVHAQEYIFEEFRQADGSTTRKFGGSGLGLALVQKLVRAMGGTIRLESQPGIGSVFFVTVPLNEESPNPEETLVETGIPV